MGAQGGIHFTYEEFMRSWTKEHTPERVLWKAWEKSKKGRREL